MAESNSSEKNTGFTGYLLKRIVVAVILCVAVLWALTAGLSYFERPGSWLSQLWHRQPATSSIAAVEPPAVDEEIVPAPPVQPSEEASPELEPPTRTEVVLPHSQAEMISPPSELDLGKTPLEKTEEITTSPTPSPQHEPPSHPAAESSPVVPPEPAPTPEDDIRGTDPPLPTPTPKAPHSPVAEPKHAPLPTGVAFVDAVIEPISYELKHRFWGWRVNDILNVTDNINNYQLGVLEVSRRTAVQLAERISRTGSTDSFDPNLENAMNWLMVKADRYWFPSPESKYLESIEELTAYKDKLLVGEASFYIRPDNIIPLLSAYEDLLGSCDENLVKLEEEDGSKVGFFKSDNYFYYAKGVASAMATILEAIHHDFKDTLESRHGSDLLHHAIESCKLAASLDPWIVIDADLDGLLANHRANMAAPISHARFYIHQLIKTLST